MRYMLAICCLASFFSVLAASNLVQNGEFIHNAEGEIYEWNGSRDTVEVLPGQGPEGKNALKLNLNKLVCFRQTELQLVAGETYRLGAWIKTKHFQASRSGVVIYDTPGWYKDVGTAQLPENCPEWTLWEKEVTAPPSEQSGMYAFGIFATTASGELWVSDFSIVPVSEKAIAESKPAPISYNKRIVPVAPLLSQVTRAADAELRFVYTAPLPAGAVVAEVVITSEPGGEQPVFTGKFPVVADSVTAQVGLLPLGEASLLVRLLQTQTDEVIAANTYTITVQEPLPEAPPARQLNNMVSEILLDLIQNRRYTFFNPREGWVYICLNQAKARDTAKVMLDDQPEPVIKYRPGEPFATMRLLSAGWHSLTVAEAGGGQIIVRAVPQLLLYPLFMEPKTDHANFRYDLDFYKKHIFPNVNIIACQANYTQEARPYLEERGISLVGCGGFSQSTWRDADKMTAHILNSWSVTTTDGRALDELAVTAPASVRHAYAQAMWNLTSLDKLIYTWVCGGHLRSVSQHADIFAAGSNVSQGRGKILYETYIVTKPTVEEMEEYLNGFRKYVADGGNLVDKPTEKMMMIMTGLISHGRWNVYNCPEVDIKFFFDRFFQILATAPEFKNLFGFGCYNIAHTDEETTRWILALMRHYGIEGNKNLLSRKYRKYRFEYLPGHIQNNDFREGLSNWIAEPATQDSIAAQTINGYGTNCQRRRRDSNIKNIGDTVAVFTRDASKANKLSQKATGLVPGKLYTLHFAVADWSDIKQRLDSMPKMPLRAILPQAEIIPELSYVHHWPVAGRKKSNNVAIDSHRILFRAQSSELDITFTDWESEENAGGEIGQQLVLNFVSLRPYFAEE